MRIETIEVSGFRAFPGDEPPYTISLGAQGKSLLLFGENGSGKSSLYEGLRRLLSEYPPHDPFAGHVNVFHPSDDASISVTMNAGAAVSFRWGMAVEHPAQGGGAAFMDVARRTTFLNWHELLRTSLAHVGSDKVDIYLLLVDTLLRNAEMAGGGTVFEQFTEARQLRDAPAPDPEDEGDEENGFDPDEDRWERTGAFCERLNDLLNLADTGVVARANHFLAQWLEPGLAVSVTYEPRSIVPMPGFRAEEPFRTELVRFILTCSYFGRVVEHPPLFLNEARLTAVAIALFLAGAEACTPQQEGKPRILVLDDILIGLDMSHRIPVLRLLQSEFSDWQILLFTHDRVWYELAKEYTKDSGEWANYELMVMQGPPGRPPKPYLKQGQDHLERARLLLEPPHNDLMGSAVHIRAWFEDLLKRKCERYKRPVEYHVNPKDFKADKFWEALKTDTRPVKGAAVKMGEALISEVEMVRSQVLNKLSHAGAPNLVQAEVEAALELMPRLKAALDKPDRPC
jgi:energy-coupling factor transporter ATP-binding protein EcfA2